MFPRRSLFELAVLHFFTFPNSFAPGAKLVPNLFLLVENLTLSRRRCNLCSPPLFSTTLNPGLDPFYFSSVKSCTPPVPDVNSAPRPRDASVFFFLYRRASFLTQRRLRASDPPPGLYRAPKGVYLKTVRGHRPFPCPKFSAGFFRNVLFFLRGFSSLPPGHRCPPLLYD